MSKLAKIIKQCSATFQPQIKNNKEAFQKNFSILTELVSSLTYTELALHPALVSRKAFTAPDKAPCTFVNVFESDLFTLTIFILKPSYSMPIHDHPGIFGILKMIHGTAKVQSYTNINHLGSTLQIGSRIEVKPELPAMVDCTTPVAIVTPNEQNFHEITTVGDQPCAFFDVLSPPFSDVNRRECSYFRKILTDNGVFLEKIPAPYTYYCDSYSYKLPEDCV